MRPERGGWGAEASGGFQGVQEVGDGTVWWIRDLVGEDY